MNGYYLDEKSWKIVHFIFSLISFSNFCCHILALQFSMKYVLFLCLMGVHVNKKTSNFFFMLWLIIMIFCLHMVDENNINI